MTEQVLIKIFHILVYFRAETLQENTIDAIQLYCQWSGTGRLRARTANEQLASLNCHAASSSKENALLNL